MRRDRGGDGCVPVRDDGRRDFLRCAAGFAGVAATGMAAATGPHGEAAAAERPAGPPDDDGRRQPPERISFHGRHQAGIVTPQQLFAGFAGFDVLAENREGLVELFQVLTHRARALTAGVKPKDELVATQPQTPDSLTVTIGVGASLFDDRYGLSGHKPRHLKAMPAFPNDRLVPARCHGDLSVQVCAEHPDAIVHVLRDLARETDGLLRPRWRADAFLNPSRPSGARRNFLGFKDGIVNPDTDSVREMRRLMWVTPPCGEPEWALDGCYQVIRLIRFHVEKWDKVPVEHQERMFGRRKASGAPLDGTRETDAPDYRSDPDGRKIALDSHIRLANPRTPQTDNSRFLRRSYNYNDGFDPNGRMNLGLVFCGYQQDPERQFATVQRRLENEPLARFITPTGGGYFFALPGVRHPRDWFGSELLKKV
ncbi:Dyp-type peroxidase [Streptomyces sp. NPDC001339]|uniref:Dyp-type peroxidase n=1 Tax=Streptomyces sp. NPDC001339 TaxID=3364563 RepID=UPI0036BC3D10